MENSSLIDKEVKIIFDDGRGGATFQGILKEYNDFHALVFTLGKLQSIPKERIIRVEEIVIK